ncbi:MAG: DNA cytosine methyltransferase [Rhodospirillales bacterium]|nr:DNA cytosine methyltransferase [Rhodospirillales bacterium]MCB9997255.1 DNA cytosine methyltransferase [Rhodospirillales bacterium]
MKKSSKYTFYEFFAGGGMARAGLGPDWECLFANDFDHKKGQTYRENWGGAELIVDDIRNISPEDLPRQANLVWGSFPCQDLSLAGGGAGLKGDRSGTFWPFILQIQELKDGKRAPEIICLENVVGTLTSHNGADFTAICRALNNLGYKFGAFIVDAALFLPQSRPRLFFVAVRNDIKIQKSLHHNDFTCWHNRALKNACNKLPQDIKTNWVFWNMPKPQKRKKNFIDIIEDNPTCTKWHTRKQTTELLSMMNEVNLAKVETAKASGVPMVGGIYKRTRYEHGIKVQRAEIRFDNIAGCLRTPAGGSSRQLIMCVDGNHIRSRLISTRETARLMGLPESYRLPSAYNEAYHLTGDGVAVPVVRHIAKYLFEPILTCKNILKTRETA